MSTCLNASRVRSARLAHGRASHHRVPFSSAVPRHIVVCSAAAPASSSQLTDSQVEDKWIAKNVAALNSTPLAKELGRLQSEAVTALKTLRIPTNRNEEYRFTDLSALTKRSLQASPTAAAVDAAFVSSLSLPSEAASLAVVVDGVLRADLCRLDDSLPQGVYIGNAKDAPAGVLEKHLGAQSHSRGGPFSVMNSAALRDALCILMPEGAALQRPLHILYVSTGSGSADVLTSSAPRLLLVAGRGSSVEIVEEFVASCAASAGQYFTNSVAEIVLEEEATVSHGYVQRDAEGAVHARCTLVEQAGSSQYSHVQASLGSSLSRHDLSVKQLGPSTHTSMRHFLLVGASQLQDLHSKLVLDHPDGVADQLHKCIVAQPSGKGVFDGNVQVNRLAQKTDAGQLSRNLLLVPRATVHVKPNLQIIADDVKCTHGCAVSDLSDEEIFYFRARGISAAAARQSLVYSFGAEVVQKLGHKQLVERIQADVNRTLSQVDIISAEEGSS